MPSLRLQRDLPFPRPAVYDVISDVARYPEFMPGFSAVTTDSADTEGLRVWQTVGGGGISTTFLSHARFNPPVRIDIASHDRPFEHLRQTWRFDETRAGTGTRVHLGADYRLADPLAAAVFNRIFPVLLRSGLSAIGRRVATLHRRHDRKRA